MKNQREIYEALLAGETLINDAHFTIKLKEDGNLDYAEDRVYGSVFNAVFKYVEDWQIYKEPKWYENIPEGKVLCLQGKVLIAIKGYDSAAHKCISVIGSYYTPEKLVPLTKQEIQVFMDNAPEAGQ